MEPANRPGTPATPAQLFEAQVIRTPHAAAVSAGDATISYTELNTRANRLARWLASRGAGPEKIVAVAVPRSPQLIVALLAAPKAGAAYLAIDPGYPSDRLESILAGVAPTCLVTDRAALHGSSAAGHRIAFLRPTPNELLRPGRQFAARRAAGLPPAEGAGPEVAVGMIFAHPSVAALARAIEARSDQPGEAEPATAAATLDSLCSRRWAVKSLWPSSSARCCPLCRVAVRV